MDTESNLSFSTDLSLLLFCFWGVFFSAAGISGPSFASYKKKNLLNEGQVFWEIV